MIVVNGFTFLCINILTILVQAFGPTPVAGTTGTTAAFQPNHSVAVHAHLR